MQNLCQCNKEIKTNKVCEGEVLWKYVQIVKKQNPDEAQTCLCGYSFEQNGEKVERKKVKSSVRKDAIDYVLYALCFLLPLVVGGILGNGLISALSGIISPSLLIRRNGYAGVLAWILSMLGFTIGIAIIFTNRNNPYLW